LDKYSVAAGGGKNHRFGLYDMVMIKENHIRVSGSITEAVELIRKKYDGKYSIEVETTNLDEVAEALSLLPEVIMLDNMSLDEMREAVKFIEGKVKTEASGNVSLDTVRSIAETGVDFISVGALTHSVKALDISLLIS
jgi:nicotinate-nucleotide pyrophosphorylase (carboxylating)